MLFSSVKALYLILFACLLTSCSDFIDDNHTSIPKECQNEVVEFMRIANSKGLNIDTYNLEISFFTSNGTVAGDASLKDTRMRIDTTSSMWHINKESLIFHELGHIYLKRKHDDSSIDGYAKSIMNSYLISYGKDKRQYYIDELFTANN